MSRTLSTGIPRANSVIPCPRRPWPPLAIIRVPHCLRRMARPYQAGSTPTVTRHLWSGIRRVVTGLLPVRDLRGCDRAAPTLSPPPWPGSLTRLTAAGRDASVPSRPIYRSCTADIREGKLGGRRLDSASDPEPVGFGCGAPHRGAAQHVGSLPGRARLPPYTGPDRHLAARPRVGDRRSQAAPGAGAGPHPHSGSPAAARA